MLSTITASIVGLISFALLDYIFLAKIAKNFYLQKLTSHLTIENGSLVPYLPAVPFVYLIAVISIWVFVLTRVHDLQHACLYGMTLGFCMYAFYDFTNLGTLKDYPWSLTILDIVWGTFLVGVVTSLMFLVKQSLA